MDREALAAERSDKVSKDARYGPNEKGNIQRATDGRGGYRPRKEDSRNSNAIPISENVRRGPRDGGNGWGKVVGAPTPDVVQGKKELEGEPMAVDEEGKMHRTKNSPNNGGGQRGEMGRESGQVRTEMVEVASEVVDMLLKRDITLPLGRLLKISPELQKGLGRVTKGQSACGGIDQNWRKEEPATRTVNLGARERNPNSLEELRAWNLSKPRDELPTVEARVGRATMEAIVDTGAMVNIISTRMYKRSGLPKNDETLRLKDVNGGSKGSLGRIEMAKIYLTPNKILTIGDLWVLDTQKFDLLLGREWQSMNNSGIKDSEG